MTSLLFSHRERKRMASLRVGRTRSVIVIEETKKENGVFIYTIEKQSGASCLCITMLRQTGSVRCDAVAKMPVTPIVFLLLLISLSLTTAVPVNNTTPPAADAQTKGSAGKISNFGRQAMLVMGITFPSAFLVGILWCYCMTTVCGIRSGSKSSLTTERVPPSNQRLSTGSRESSESSIS